ncbi:MAG: hypothetical protein ACK4YQ_16905 [Phenylobacterium sp.]|uniref:hypothetical protein n=1 Tax=Phenylobacterium sp. TaxID=1871053 RepID=UPI0039195E48
MLESVQAFKAGKHRAIDGRVYEFSEADVAAIAASYDPALQAAPVVLGHPKTNDPAWAWVKGLKVEGGVLVADLERVAPAFAEAVDDGRYRYRSAAFYAPGDPSNPKPGAWYLRHVGYLGATPPAVKGLETAFSGEAESFVAFGVADGFWVKDLLRGVRDFFIEKFSLEDADRVLPSWAIDNIEREQSEPAAAFAEGDADPAPAGADTDAADVGADTTPAAAAADAVSGGAADDQLAEREAALQAREASVAQREAAFAESARQDARTEDAAYLDGLVAAGRLPPVHRDRVAAIFARLGGDQTVAFSEPDADPRAELRELLDGLGVSIAFAEVSGSDGFDATSAAAAPQIAEQIQAIRSEAAGRGETLSYSQAAARIGR